MIVMKIVLMYHKRKVAQHTLRSSVCCAVRTDPTEWGVVSPKNYMLPAQFL